MYIDNQKLTVSSKIPFILELASQLYISVSSSILCHQPQLTKKTVIALHLHQQIPSPVIQKKKKKKETNMHCMQRALRSSV